MKNKGSFSVILNQETNQYEIVHIEQGVATVIDNPSCKFNDYVKAKDYIKDNREKLDGYVTKIKAELKKKKEAEEAARRELEEEKNKKKGTFSVIYDEDDEKYEIIYNEAGMITFLVGDKYSFDSYDEGYDYINNNQEELEEYIAKVKEDEEIAERIKEEKEAKDKANKERKVKEAKKFGLHFLISTLILVIGHFAGTGISYLIKKDKEDYSATADADKESDPSFGTIEEPTLAETEESTEAKEILTDEVYSNLVVNYTDIYKDMNVASLTDEDISKFVSIMNQDELMEENMELAAELFNSELQAKEEYLGDAAKVIGATYTVNRNIFQEEGKTENFIRISESMYGTQKEQMLVIEEYVDKIAEARGNSEKVNELVAEYIEKLSNPQSELAYLDDGVGFCLQVYNELILSCIAKDDLNQENRDMLMTWQSSERYVSNIFTNYDECGSYSKKLAK